MNSNLVQLEPLLALAPQIVLLGAPHSARPAPASLRSVLAQQGIALEVMDLGAACRTFNILVQEGAACRRGAVFLKKEPP